MDITLALLLFSFIILLYWVITEVFTFIFRLTGLPAEKARFQVISLLTGCGFTTRESEMILSSRRRRRLARITMLFGYVFNVTIVSAFINVFLSMKLVQVGYEFLSLLIPSCACRRSTPGATISSAVPRTGSSTGRKPSTPSCWWTTSAPNPSPR